MGTLQIRNRYNALPAFPGFLPAKASGTQHPQTASKPLGRWASLLFALSTLSCAPGAAFATSILDCPVGKACGFSAATDWCYAIGQCLAWENSNMPQCPSSARVGGKGFASETDLLNYALGGFRFCTNITGHDQANNVRWYLRPGEIAGWQPIDMTPWGTTTFESRSSIGVDIPLPPPNMPNPQWVGQGARRRNSICTNPAASMDSAGFCHEPATEVCPVGNPVDPIRGSKEWQETDITISGRPALVRYYSSRMLSGATGRASMGEFWRHSFERSLYISPNQIGVYRANGRAYFFNLVGGQWVSNRNDYKDRLVASGANLVLTTADNEDVETYDSQGRLLTIVSRDKSSWTVSYNSNGRIGSVSDERGRNLTFTYDTGSHLATITDPAGKVFSYSVLPSDGSSFARLVSIAYPADTGTPTRVYHYEVNGSPYLLTGITDENAVRYTTYAYDTSERVSESYYTASAANNIGRKTYLYPTPYTGSSGAQTQVTDALGTTLTYTFVNAGGVGRLQSVNHPCPSCGGGMVKSKTFDANGYTDTETDFKDTVTDRDIDPGRGLETRRIEAKFTPDPLNPPTLITPPEKRTIDTVWHATLRVPTHRTVTNASNAIESQTDWTYNARGQVLTRTMTDPAPPYATRTTTYTYCDSLPSAGCGVIGSLKSIDGPRTDVSDITSYAYYTDDAPGCAASPTTCLYRKGDLQSVTNALGQTTDYLKYDGDGRVLQVRDANNVVTDMEYSPRGWLTARKVRGVDDNTENDDAITRLSYDNAGQVTRVTQPDGAYLDYTYDAAHRLTDITDNLGNKIHYTLDPLGKRIAEDTKDPNPSPNGTIKRSLSRVYDNLSQLQQLKNAAGVATVTNTYDANQNLDTATDGLNHVSDNDYDPLNRLKQQIQDKGAGKINATTIYQYDARDNLRQVTDPKSLPTVYAYDGLNNLTSLNSPDTGVTGYGYDAAGNRTSRTDARNVVSNYTYDALNRLQTISYPANAALNVAYIYDTPNSECGATENFAKGRLSTATVQDGSSQTRYCYDRRGNVTRKREVIAGTTYETRTSFNLADRPTQMIYPSGTVVDYTRDAMGRVSQVKVTPAGAAQSTVISAVNYLPFGPLSQLTWGNGQTLSKTYDLDYGIDRVQSSASGGLSLDFTLDSVGNIVNADALPANTPPDETYSYDALNRLLGVTNAASAPVESYTYDATGDRLSKKVGVLAPEPYGYETTSHRLLQLNAGSRTYDASGNIKLFRSGSRSGPSMSYDESNRARQYLLNGGAIADYRYNAAGERVAKNDPVTSTNNRNFVYGASGQLIGEYLTVKGWSPEYIYLDTLPIAVLTGAALYTIETDHLGTPRSVRDASNVEVWRWNFLANPFGEQAANEDPDGNGVLFKMGLRFPGQYFDAESGLNYNYFRDYEPGTGRYVESDPIGLDAGVSTYSYVRSAPLTFFDLKGLDVQCDIKTLQDELGTYPVRHNCRVVPDPVPEPPKCGEDCTSRCVQRRDECQRTVLIVQIGGAIVAVAGTAAPMGSTKGICVAGGAALAWYATVSLKPYCDTSYKHCLKETCQCKYEPL